MIKFKFNFEYVLPYRSLIMFQASKFNLCLNFKFKKEIVNAF